MSAGTDERSEPSALQRGLGPVVFLLAIGYVVIGILWADAHRADRPSLIGPLNFLVYLSQLLLWPLHALGVWPS